MTHTHIDADKAIEALRKVTKDAGAAYIYKEAIRAENRAERKRRVEGDPSLYDFSASAWNHLDGDTPEERKESYINQSVRVECHYAEDAQPSCGVGRAFYVIDLEAFEVLREAEEANGPFPIMEFDPSEEYPLSVTDDARRVFAAFQDNQDRGETYGDSLEAAEKVYEEVTR